MKKCVLIGNYGVGNIGDEALCEYFLNVFPDVSWTVVSHKGSYQDASCVPRLPFGVRSLFRTWWRTLHAIACADAVVFGGGSLFTDIESVRACVLWWWHGFVARLLDKPLVFAFQGVGPFRTKLGLSLARSTLERAAFISVRDEESLKRLSSWHLRVTPVLTFDPAFARFAQHQRKSESRRLVLIPRTNSDKAFFHAVSEKVALQYSDIHILLMQPSPAEMEAGERLHTLCGVSSSIVEIQSVSQLLEEVSRASHVISQRYHGALAALAMEVSLEVVPQKKGDKMDALNTALGSRKIWLEKIDIGELALKSFFKRFL